MGEEAGEVRSARRRRWRSVRPEEEVEEEVEAEGEEREKETEERLRVRDVVGEEVMVVSAMVGCGDAARFSSQSGCTSALLSSSRLAMAEDDDSWEEETVEVCHEESHEQSTAG